MTRRKILIVDDEAMIAEAMNDIISLLGHQVTWFESGTEAVKMAGGRGFDLAVVDLELPGMRGIEVADELARLEPGIRILFVTGFSDQEDLIDYSQGHVSGIIHKPFEMAELQEAVEKALAEP